MATPRDGSKKGWMRGLFGRRGDRSYDPSSGDDLRFRVYVNPVGLTPWMWGGIRGEVFVGFIALLIVLGGMFHWYWAALGVSVTWLLIGWWLSQWHPYWPEMVLRLLVQPIGFLDT